MEMDVKEAARPGCACKDRGRVLAPLLLRWNQPMRPGPHVAPFVAASPEAFPAAALQILRRFPPDPAWKLVMQAPAMLKRSKSPDLCVWGDLPCGLWPAGDMAAMAEELERKASSIWAMAAAMLLGDGKRTG